MLFCGVLRFGPASVTIKILFGLGCCGGGQSNRMIIVLTALVYRPHGKTGRVIQTKLLNLHFKTDSTALFDWRDLCTDIPTLFELMIVPRIWSHDMTG